MEVGKMTYMKAKENIMCLKKRYYIRFFQRREIQVISEETVAPES